MLTRRVIMILSAVSLGTLHAAIILVAAPGAIACRARDLVHAQARSALGSFFASALLLVAFVTGIVAWTMGMLQTADEKRWGWFVAVLLLGAIGSLAYGLAKPEAISAGD